jgi:hypothetical protein
LLVVVRWSDVVDSYPLTSTQYTFRGKGKDNDSDRAGLDSPMEPAVKAVQRRKIISPPILGREAYCVEPDTIDP